MPRDREGNVVMPRIVHLKPRPGDVHPITRRQFKMVFDRLPLEYLYNLKTVELLPREGDIGSPFAFYSAREKRIVIYSLPLIWETNHMDELGADLFGPYLRIEEHRAQFETDGNTARVTWANESQMGFWFCRIVLLHEFSHHFRATYPSKRKPGYKIKTGYEELFADQKANDLWAEVFPNAAKAYERARLAARERRRPEIRRRLAARRRRREITVITERNSTSRHD
jgi:hypothetical protein